MIKSMIFGVLLLPSVVFAMDISPAQADAFLLNKPIKSTKVPGGDLSKKIESLAEPMFNGGKQITTTRGYQNFKVMQNYASSGNPLALYNVGMYMMINQSQFEFKLSDALLNLKKASDSGVLDAKYSLALVYINRSEEVARLINSSGVGGSARTDEDISKDAHRLRQIAYTYILDLSSKGYEKAFLLACNYYVRGEFLPKDMTKASICYSNAVAAYQSPVAMGLLAKIYFDDPGFNTEEYEKKGMELAAKAASMGDNFSLALLGKQIIYPKFISKSYPQKGAEYIKQAANEGGELGITYLRQFFDGAGRLIVKPSKPMAD